MALSQEQLDQLEFLKASALINNKMEAIRVARDILIENDRNKAVSERGISDSDLTTLAGSITTFINT